MHTGTLSREVKRQGLETGHSPPYSVEVKKGEAIPPLPHTHSWSGAYRYLTVSNNIMVET
jgi:hypothetical protein